LNRQEARVATTISVKEALRQERPFRGGGSLLFNSGGVDRQVVFTKVHFHAMQPAEISPHLKKYCNRSRRFVQTLRGKSVAEKSHLAAAQP